MLWIGMLIHKTLSNNGRSRYQRSFWSLKPPVSQYLCGQEFQISISHIRNSIIVSMLSTWGQWRADCGAKARVSVNLGHRGWPLLVTAGKEMIAAAAARGHLLRQHCGMWRPWGHGQMGDMAQPNCRHFELFWLIFFCPFPVKFLITLNFKCILLPWAHSKTLQWCSHKI